jgi:uncharacterized protein
MYTQWLKAEPRGHPKRTNGTHAIAHQRAQQWLSRSRPKPRGDAAFRLGNRHFLAKNVTKAIRCYQLAANAGHAAAQYNLGLLYLKGEGVARDALYGLEWLAKAADSGDKKARELLHKIDRALAGR